MRLRHTLPSCLTVALACARCVLPNVSSGVDDVAASEQESPTVADGSDVQSNPPMQSEAGEAKAGAPSATMAGRADGASQPAVGSPEMDAGLAVSGAGSKATDGAGAQIQMGGVGGPSAASSGGHGAQAGAQAGAQDAPVEPDAGVTEEYATMVGPFEVASYSDGFAESELEAGTIYYPMGAGASLPSVVIAPPYPSNASQSAEWAHFLASHGVVVMAHARSYSVPGEYVAGLVAAFAALERENARVGSPLANQLDVSRQCVAGVSVGGGGAFVFAAMNPALKCSVGFTPWPGQVSGGSTSVPTLVFAGAEDPLDEQMLARAYYETLPDTTPSMYFEVAAAGGLVASAPSRSEGIIGKYCLAWLKVHLEGDMRYKKFLLAPKPAIASMVLSTFQ